MSLYAPTLARQKPPRWAPVSKGLVAPEWQWAWRGLVGAWLFNDGGGTNLFDYSGNRNDGSGVNITGADWVSSPYGAAVDFDGSSEYFNCGNKAPLVIPGRNLTVRVISSLHDVTSYRILASKINATWAAEGEWQLHVNTGVLTFYCSDGTTAVYCDYAITTNKWYDIFGTLRPDGQALYVDGIQRDTDPTITLRGTTSSVRIGCRFTAPANYFDGINTLVCIWNRGLSANEVARLTLNPFAPFRMAEEEDYRVPSAGGVFFPYYRYVHGG